MVGVDVREEKPQWVNVSLHGRVLGVDMSGFEGVEIAECFTWPLCVEDDVGSARCLVLDELAYLANHGVDAHVTLWNAPGG